MFSSCRELLVGSAIAFVLLGTAPGVSHATQLSDAAYRQAVAEAAYGSEDVATFYRTRRYAPVFTGEDDLARRAALVAALRSAPMHGLPASRYDAGALIDTFRTVTGARSRGQAESAAARMFLALANDLTSGALVPSRIDGNMVRVVEKRDALELLTGFANARIPQRTSRVSHRNRPSTIA